MQHEYAFNMESHNDLLYVIIHRVNSNYYIESFNFTQDAETKIFKKC